MPKKTPVQSQQISRLLLVGFIVVGTGLGIFWLTRTPSTNPETKTSISATQIAAVTPKAYTMISGPIVALDPAAKTIGADFSYIDESGQNKTKRYVVTIDSATKIQAVNQSSTPASVSSIDFSTLAVGDQIDAVDEENLAPIDAFTAASIIQYIR